MQYHQGRNISYTRRYRGKVYQNHTAVNRLKNMSILPGIVKRATDVVSCLLDAGLRGSWTNPATRPAVTAYSDAPAVTLWCQCSLLPDQDHDGAVGSVMNAGRREAAGLDGAYAGLDPLRAYSPTASRCSRLRRRCRLSHAATLTCRQAQPRCWCVGSRAFWYSSAHRSTGLSPRHLWAASSAGSSARRRGIAAALA